MRGGTAVSESSGGRAPTLPGSTDAGTAVARNCGEAPPSDRPFSKENLLRSTAECAVLRFCEFESAAVDLASRARSYVESPRAETLGPVQQAFRTAMASWARADLFQFGPTASSTKDPQAGRGLRDVLYSWPNVSRCRVEEQLFGRAYAEQGFDNLVQVPINSRGLFAVEYLAFFDGSDNACSPFSITNADDAWANTSEERLSELKREYLGAVSEDLALRASQLVDSWTSDGGGFLQELVSAGAYQDQQQALNLVAHAMIYLEREVKDYKLGAPAGLFEGAPLERAEMSFAGSGTQLIQQNLTGFRDLFTGCNGEGLGFDDWLLEAGHADLADDVLTSLAAAEQAAADFPPLSEASQSQLTELHTAVKAVTDLLKSELFGQGSPLGLTLPTAVEGDTD